MIQPITKAGAFLSPTILAFARRRPCAMCCAAAPVDPHHFPPKGMGGANIDDTSVIPLCRYCHGKAQRYEAPCTREWQHNVSRHLLADFVKLANEHEWAAFCAERKRFVEGRVLGEVAW